LIPPSGAVAGIYARIDNKRGVWKAPAGVECTITDAIKAEYQLIDTEQDILNPNNVNCVRSFPGAGTIIWGNHALTGVNINHQRLKIYIKSYFNKNFKWTVFEPIDDTLLGETGTVTMNGNIFMDGLYRNGAFDGPSPKDAYFTKCDRQNNPDTTIKQNKLNIDIGYKNKGVAEFVLITVGLSK
jgi:phage tail sheath protein FI